MEWPGGILPWGSFYSLTLVWCLMLFVIMWICLLQIYWCFLFSLPLWWIITNAAYYYVIFSGPHPPAGLHDGASTSSGHHIYLYGGWDEHLHLQGSLYQLDCWKLEWSLLSSGSSTNSPMPKTGAAMIFWRDFLCLFGGWTGTQDLDELHLFDLGEGEGECRQS